jgi:2-methylcitrate dehydratase PrpD
MDAHCYTLDDALLEVLRWLWANPGSAEPPVDARARELLLDTLGCAIAGTAEPEVAALFRNAAAADPGVIRFPGVLDGMSAAGFAASFAAAACWHEACEGLAVAHGRPGLHAIPAVLGPALARRVPLAALVDAVAAGFEIGGRLGIVCRIRPAMHVDGTWGSFGAAAAACHLSGASPETALDALNHVACHLPFSLYRPIVTGSTARNTYAGHGAMHGAAAAVASLSGLGGPRGSIAEMARLALGLAPETLLGFPGLGRRLLQEGYLKPYPAVRHVHYGAVAAERWRAAGLADPAKISAVTLRVYQEALTYCGNRAPATAIQAQFSLSFGVAHSLAHGRLEPVAYSAAGLADPLTRRLEALLVLEPDPEHTAQDRRGCTLSVRAAGTAWEELVDTIPGDPARPMTRAEIADKFLAYAGPVIGDAHARTIAGRLLDGPATQPLELEP